MIWVADIGPEKDTEEDVLAGAEEDVPSSLALAGGLKDEDDAAGDKEFWSGVVGDELSPGVPG